MHNAWDPRACLLQKCWRKLIDGVAIGISISGDTAVDLACLRRNLAPSQISDDEVNGRTLKSDNFWRLQQRNLVERQALSCADSGYEQCMFVGLCRYIQHYRNKPIRFSNSTPNHHGTQLTYYPYSPRAGRAQRRLGLHQ